MNEPESPHNGKQRPPTLWQSWLSVMAAFFGVQSNTNRERDAAHGRASHFIVLGLVATALFVLLLIGLVRLIMAFARRRRSSSDDRSVPAPGAA